MDSLLQRVAAGDDSAIEAVVSLYGDLVWRIAVRRLGRNHPELEDAVQSAFLDVWRNAGRYDPARGSEAGFIGVIAAHRTIDILRQGPALPPRVDRAQLGRQKAAGAPNEQGSTDPELMRAFSGLREEEQDALRLRYHAGMSYDEIATALGSKPATIRSRVFQGLRRLRTGVAVTAEPETMHASSTAEGQRHG